MKKRDAFILLFIILIFIVAIIAYLLTNTQRSYVKTDVEKKSPEQISCVATSPSELFFELKTNPIKAEHKITASFYGDTLDKLFYSFQGEFDSDNDAVAAQFDILDKYNKHVNQSGLKQDVLSHNVSANQNSVDASFYAERGDMNSALMPIFFLNADEYNARKGGLKEYLMQNYKSKGFSCEQK